MRFFFAQTLLSSITLSKRFRTKFTYDYKLCIIHALNIISHHHRLNFEFLVGCFAVGKLRVERKLHVVLAPIVHDFLYLRRLLNQILFFSRGEIGQMTHPPLNGSFPPQLSVTKSSSWNLNRLAELCSDILLFSTALIVRICHTSIATLSYSNFITV